MLEFCLFIFLEGVWSLCYAVLSQASTSGAGTWRITRKEQTKTMSPPSIARGGRPSISISALPWRYLQCLSFSRFSRPLSASCSQRCTASRLLAATRRSKVESEYIFHIAAGRNMSTELGTNEHLISVGSLTQDGCRNLHFQAVIPVCMGKKENCFNSQCGSSSKQIEHSFVSTTCAGFLRSGHDCFYFGNYLYCL